MHAGNQIPKRTWAWIVLAVFSVVVIFISGIIAFSWSLVHSGLIFSPNFPPSTQPTGTLHWDWTHEHTTETTDWPLNMHGEIWFIEEPTRIIIDLPDGKRLDMVTQHSHVYREGQIVTGITILPPSESALDAYKRACSLMKEWGYTNRDELDKWYALPEQIKEATPTLELPGPKNSMVNTSIIMSPSFDYRTGRPWCVEFLVGINDSKLAP